MINITLNGILFMFISSIIAAANTIAAVPSFDYENHDHIRKSVMQFLTAKSKIHQLDDIRIQVGKLDRRLKLNKCIDPLDIDMNNNTMIGNLSVSVSCNSQQAWKIYIPASIQAYKSIYVAKSHILRGEEISPHSVELIKQNVTSLHGNYITNIMLIEGTVAKRLINKGQVVSPHMLAKLFLIKRGEIITIIAEISGISVSMKGKALNNAAIGEQVRVKNINSKRIIEGTAIKRGQVKINIL